MSNEQEKTLLTIQEVARAHKITVHMIANIGDAAKESRLAIDRFLKNLRAFLALHYLGDKRGILCRHSGKFRKFK